MRNGQLMQRTARHKKKPILKIKIKNIIFNDLFMVPCCHKTPEEERSPLFSYDDGDEKDGDGASDNDEEET